ncbi:hypothetical protein JTB14_022227 [Gonioctena quinquepunctata]|nr:hypothetical protein JTB14_022227 [Gonioctena quinquepunctata]
MYLHEEMEKLITENQEKDTFIKRLRKLQPFQDEVVSLEEDLLRKLKNQENEMAKLKSEKNELALRNKYHQVELEEALKKMTKLNEKLDELNKINKEMLTSIETLSEQNLANLKEIEVMKQENCSLELKMIQKSKREDEPKPVPPRKNRDGKISNRKTEKENKTC